MGVVRNDHIGVIPGMERAAPGRLLVDALRFWGDWMAARNPPSLAAFDAYERARGFVERGRTTGLVELYGSCLDALEAGDPARAAAANHNLAVAMQAEGDLDGALFHCVRALYLYHRLSDESGTWAGLRNLSLVFQARGESRRALEAKRKAARLRVDADVSDGVEGVDGGGEPLLLLSVKAGRALRAVGD